MPCCVPSFLKKSDKIEIYENRISFGAQLFSDPHAPANRASIRRKIRKLTNQHLMRRPKIRVFPFERKF
jgi:hypothetical protein